MNESVSINNKAGETVFNVAVQEMEKATLQEKGGDNFYLLEYDYAKDLLVKNRDPETVMESLHGLCYLVDNDLKGEEFYLLVSTVLEADMIEASADVEFGTILQIAQNGELIADLSVAEKKSFSVVDDSELADLNIEMPTAKGEYVDPAAALVQTFKKEGYESYERKDVLKKYEEEKRQKDDE